MGTRDGTTIEMAEEAGEENFFLLGISADQVANSRAWYNPHWHYENEPETRKALDLIFSDHFSRNEPGIFEPLRGALLTHGDVWMHLADLTSYLRADCLALRALFEAGRVGGRRASSTSRARASSPATARSRNTPLKSGARGAR